MNVTLFFASTRACIRLSCSRISSASLSIRSICSLVRRPVSLVIVMRFLFPVDLSSALTFSMPFASTSKPTSICGTPRGAGGMFVSSKVPSYTERRQGTHQLLGTNYMKELVNVWSAG